MNMLNHIIPRNFRCEVLLLRCRKTTSQEMLMRLSTPLRLVALAFAVVTGSAAVSESVGVKSSAFPPPPFPIIHAGMLLAVGGKNPVTNPTIADENNNIKIKIGTEPV